MEPTIDPSGQQTPVNPIDPASLIQHPEMSPSSRGRIFNVWGLSLLVLVLLIAAYFVAAYFIKFWPFTETNNNSPLVSGKSVYYEIIQSNELIGDYENGGTTNYAIPTTRQIIRYDTGLKQAQDISGVQISPENVNNEHDLNLLPRVAWSADGKKSATAFGNLSVINLDDRKIDNYEFSSENGVDLSSPAFSPDGKKVAVFTRFMSDSIYSSPQKTQVLAVDLATRQNSVLLDLAELQKAGNPTDYALLPLRWFNLNGKEYLLLEQREVGINLNPFLITGFWLYDFSSKQLQPVNFYKPDGTAIKDCDKTSPIRLEFGHREACPEVTAFDQRSPDGRYLSVQDIYPNDERQYMLDMSVVEKGLTDQVLRTGTVDFVPCYDRVSWTLNSTAYYCSTIDGPKAAADTSIEQVLKNRSIVVPYVYLKGDVANKSRTKIKQDEYTYELNGEIIEDVTSELQGIKEALAKKEVTQEEYNEYSDFAIKGYILNEALTFGKLKRLIGTLNDGKFLLGASSTPSRLSNPTEHVLYISDLAGNEEQIVEHKASDVAGKDAVANKLRELKAEAYIETMNKADTEITEIKDWRIRQEVYVRFLGSGN